MPLRDHFRPPFSTRRTWEEFHGMWPGEIVRHLRDRLPAGFEAGPQVHLGPFVEIDIGTYEQDVGGPAGYDPPADDGATAAWAATLPVVAVETELPDDDEYEVRIYDATRGRTLVATIELVSPGNKDRPDKRNAFVGKCAALLRKGVAVSIVDLITARHANLFADLLGFVGHADLGPPAPPPLYAASCRWVPRGKKASLEYVSHELTVGEALPTLPLWLGPDLVIPLDLEASYQQTCYDLRLT